MWFPTGLSVPLHPYPARLRLESLGCWAGFWGKTGGNHREDYQVNLMGTETVLLSFLAINSCLLTHHAHRREEREWHNHWTPSRESAYEGYSPKELALSLPCLVTGRAEAVRRTLGGSGEEGSIEGTCFITGTYVWHRHPVVCMGVEWGWERPLLGTRGWSSSPQSVAHLPLRPTLCDPHHVLFLPRPSPSAKPCPLLPGDPTKTSFPCFHDLVCLSV